MTKHRIITGDSRRMGLLGDESIHLAVTSPPYWQLKDYGAAEQIGYNDSYENYINNLNLVWQECHRVLHKGCRLCINIGDQFARAVYYGRYKVIPIRTEIIKFCEATGFDYMGAVIWQKTTTSNSTGGGAVMGSFPYPRNGIVKLDYEFILIFKKLGNPPRPSAAQKAASRLTREEWNTYFAGHWRFPGVKQRGHLAMFPEELPARLIKMFSFSGETVLDPFLGSGTTSLAAKNLRRHSVGYEINAEFLPVIARKLGIHQAEIAGDEYEFLREVPSDSGDEAIAALPYVFRDPHGWDKKADPKRFSFGSKIDGTSVGETEYHRVEEIIGPAAVRLSNGKVVRLIGIRENAAVAAAAVSFLAAKTKGQRVFIVSDGQEHDEHGNLRGYLFLKNKTFLNAHLLKQGLADVDTATNFKHKERFLRIGAPKGLEC